MTPLTQKRFSSRGWVEQLRGYSGRDVKRGADHQDVAAWWLLHIGSSKHRCATSSLSSSASTERFGNPKPDVVGSLILRWACRKGRPSVGSANHQPKRLRASPDVRFFLLHP